jgi:hypothetical protein
VQFVVDTAGRDTEEAGGFRLIAFCGGESTTHEEGFQITSGMGEIPVMTLQVLDGMRLERDV